MKQKIERMNKTVRKKMVKGKSWIVVSTTVLALGLFTYNATGVSASVSEWTARTPEEVVIEYGEEYLIVWGDTLWAISEASGVSIDALVEINDIANRDFIYAGNTLVINDNGITITEQNGKESSFKIEGTKVEAVEEIEPVIETDQLATVPVVTVDEPNLIVDSEEESKEVIEEVLVDKESGKIVEETPTSEGETTEHTDVIEEEIIEEDSDVPDEGVVEEEVEETPTEEVVDEKEEVVTPTEPPEDEEETPEVIRTTKTITITTPIQSGVEYRNDSELPVGETRTVEGTAGQVVEIVQQVLENGKVISETLLDTQHTPSTPAIIYHGTKSAEIKRVKKKRTVETVLEHGQIIEENSELPKGKSKVLQEGIDGKRTEIVHQVFENDVLISEELIDTQVVDAVPEIIEVGTKEEAQTSEVETKVVTEEVVTDAPATITEYSNELLQGEEVVKQEGTKGLSQIVYEVTYENSVEVSRIPVDETVLQQGTPQIIIRGTKDAVTEQDVKTERIEVVQPETIRRETTDLNVGEERVVQEGQAGIKEMVTTTTYINNEVSDVATIEIMVTEARPTIIEIGTKDVIETIEEKETVSITQPDTIRRETSELEFGKERILQEGNVGSKDIITTISYINGVETGRDSLEIVTTEARETIIEVGTAPVITTKTVTETKEIPIEDEIEYNPLMFIDSQIIHKEGTPRIVEQVIEISYKDGVEVSREVVKEIVVQEGSAAQIEQGTREDHLIYSAHAIDNNGSPLANETIAVYDSKQLIDTIQTDQIGYYISHLIPNIIYDVYGNGYHSQVLGTNDDEFVVKDYIGETEVGRTITTPQSEIKFKPSAKVYDLEPENVVFAPDESWVIVDRVIDINVGETIYISPELGYLTGQVFNVGSYDTNGQETLIYTAPTNWEELVEYIKIDTGDEPISIGDMEIYSQPWVDVELVELESEESDKENEIMLFRSAPQIDENVDYEVILNIDFDKLFEKEFANAVSVEDYSFKLNDFELTKNPIEIPIGDSLLKIFGNKTEFIHDGIHSVVDKDKNFSIIKGDNFVTASDNNYELNYDELNIKTHDNKVSEITYGDQIITVDENGKAVFGDDNQKIAIDQDSIELIMDKESFKINQNGIEYSNGEMQLIYDQDNFVEISNGTTIVRLHSDDTVDMIIGDFSYTTNINDLKDFSISTGKKEFDLVDFEISKSNNDTTDSKEDDDSSDNAAIDFINRFEGSGDTRVRLNGDLQIFADIDGVFNNYAYVKQDLNATIDTTVKLAFTEQDEPYEILLATLIVPQVPIASIDVSLVFDLAGNMEIITSMSISATSELVMDDLTVTPSISSSHEMKSGSVSGEGSGKLGLEIVPQIGIDHLGAELTFAGTILPQIKFETSFGEEGNGELITEGKVDGNLRGDFSFELGFTSKDLGKLEFLSDQAVSLDFNTKEDKTFLNEAAVEFSLTGIDGMVEIFDKTFPIWSFTSVEETEDLFILLNTNKLGSANFTIDGESFTNDFFGDSVISEYIKENENSYEGEVIKDGTYWVVDLDEVVSKMGTEYFEILSTRFWNTHVTFDLYALHVNTPDLLQNETAVVGGQIMLPEIKNLLEVRGLPDNLEFSNENGEMISNEITSDMIGDHIVYVISRELITGDATGLGDTVEYPDTGEVYNIDNKNLYNYYIDSFKLSIVEPTEV